MAAFIMMYVLPMMLGQTYHLGKDKPGLMIFPTNIEDKTVKIDRYFTDSQYRMVENAEEVKEFLDVSGKISLKIKSGVVNIDGEGRYLKDSSSKSNGLEILVKLHFETVTFTIPSSVRPNADWSTFPDRFLGTHYCRSLTYGGDLVASIRITGSDQFDLERIKGAVNGGVKTSGDSFEGDIKGKLEILKQNAEGSSSMEINYYASVPLHGVSYTIDGLMKLIDDFPEHVKKVNKGLGNPLRMELFPLNSLKTGYPEYYENKAIQDELDDLENQFDDLRSTRHQLQIWINELPPIIPDLVQKKIADFTSKLESIYAVYVKSIADLDVSKGASTQPVKDAFEAYKDKGNMLYQKYSRAFQSLQSEVYKEAHELAPKIGGLVYIRWGRSDCSSMDTDIVMSGVATASDLHTSGGSSDFLCSPLQPDFVKPDDYFDNKKREYGTPYAHLSPIRYEGALMENYKSMYGKNMACARCRSTSRTALLIKMAAKTCPEGWTKEYDGYLMAPNVYSKGQYICVDKEMKQPDGKVSFGDVKFITVQNVKEATVSCGSLPCGPYEDSKPINCVVCTI